MRTLGISAIALAVGLAALSVIFIGLAYDNGWSGGSTCSMAESLCRRPSLMAIPVFATMAWGLMLTGKAASVCGADPDVAWAAQ